MSFVLVTKVTKKTVVMHLEKAYLFAISSISIFKIRIKIIDNTIPSLYCTFNYGKDTNMANIIEKSDSSQVNMLHFIKSKCQ